MNVNVLHLISVSFRIAIVSVTNISMQAYLTGKILKRRHSYWGFIIMMVEKVLIYSILIRTICNFYFEGEKWLMVINDIAIWTHCLFAYAVYCWTFEGDILKIAVIASVGEIPISLLCETSLAFVNLLEGRANVWTFGEEFQLADLLIPVIEISLVVLICRILKTYLKKIAVRQIMHRRIWWFAFITYIVGASMTQYTSWKTMEETNYFAIGYYVFLVSASVFLVRRYHKRIQGKRDFLKVQQSLMEIHYRIIQEQIQKMEENKILIDRQMEEIQSLQWIEKTTIASYMEQLKNNYFRIQAGIYCDDWLIDAFLCSQESIFCRKGMRLECYLQGYDRGDIEEKDVVKILTILLDYAVKIGEPSEKIGEQEIILKAARVKNQLVMELYTKAERKGIFPKQKLQSYIRSYKGDLMIQQMEDDWHIVITLSAGNFSGE